VSETKSLQGWSPPMATDAERRAAVNAAFDYRGDVTLFLQDGVKVAGFVSNRDFDAGAPYLEIFTATSAAPQRIPLSEVVGIEFTGADTAAGKSWDLWLKKVADAEAEGKIAELYPDD
jgi:hypothetical protein